MKERILTFLSGVSFGMGKHSILLQDPVTFTQATLATEVLYIPASACIKFSVLLLYHKIFEKRWLRITLRFIAGFLIIFSLAQMLSVIIRCKPAAALWDPYSHPDAICDEYVPALIAFAAINAATEIIILCLPLPSLWQLNADKTRKRQWIGIFLLGGL